MTKLRDIINENLPELAEQYFTILLDRPESVLIDASRKKSIVEAFEKVMTRLPLDKPDYTLSTAMDVIKAVCEGTITVREAKELMNILSVKFNMEELPKMMKELNHLTSGRTQIRR